MHLTLPRYALQGQPFGCPDSLLANPSNPRGFCQPTLCARYAKRPFRGVLCIWRREWDSNPRKV